MAETSLSLDGLRAKIGEEWEPRVYEVEKGMIRRFVQAIDDPNPLWQDEEYANKSKYGGIIAPPTFVLAWHTPCGLNGADGKDNYRPDCISIIAYL